MSTSIRSKQAIRRADHDRSQEGEGGVMAGRDRELLEAHFVCLSIYGEVESGPLICGPAEG